MDANEMLTEIREICARVVRGDGADGEVARLAELVMGLDEWIGSGRELPRDWVHARVAQHYTQGLVTAGQLRERSGESLVKHEVDGASCGHCGEAIEVAQGHPSPPRPGDWAVCEHCYGIGRYTLGASGALGLEAVGLEQLEQLAPELANDLVEVSEVLRALGEIS